MKQLGTIRNKFCLKIIKYLLNSIRKNNVILPYLIIYIKG